MPAESFTASPAVQWAGEPPKGAAEGEDALRGPFRASDDGAPPGSVATAGAQTAQDELTVVHEASSGLPSTARSTPVLVVRVVLCGVLAGAGAWALRTWATGPQRLVAAVTVLVVLPVLLAGRPAAAVRHPADRLGSCALVLAMAALALPATGALSAAATGAVAVLSSAYAAVALSARVPRRVLTLCSAEELARLTQAVAPTEVQYVPYLDRERRNDVGLAELCLQERADLVVLGASRLGEPGLTEEVAELYNADLHVRTVGEFIEELGGRVLVHHVAPRWFLRDVMAVHNRGYRALRYGVDLVVGAVGCLVLLVLLPFLALAIKLDSPGPVFYRQVRVGRAGRTFRLLKLRTMTSDAERDGPRFASTGDPRITRVGRVLRISRLDEVPQVWNVLRGEMTLIGPRPERPEFVHGPFGQIPYFDFRHIVRPGVTGWAQVTEGYASDFPAAVRKLERDLYYLRHQGVALDVRVLVLTVACVLRMAGR